MARMLILVCISSEVESCSGCGLLTSPAHPPSTQLQEVAELGSKGVNRVCNDRDLKKEVRR